MKSIKEQFVKKYNIDSSSALQWLEMEHSSGNLKATTFLGTVYSDCVFVEPNVDKAYELFKFAADKGSTDALREIGTLYFLGRYFPEDEQKAFEIYSEVLQKNPSDEIAKCQIGRMYGFGWGFPKDVHKGISILQEAWNMGSARAATEIGVLYENHLERNIENINQALKWYQRGAEGNDEKGCYNLGLIYHNGDYGVPQSEKMAHDLLIKGKVFSDALALLISTKGCGHSSDDEYRLLFEEALRRANYGDLDIQSELGYTYAQGKHIERDIEKSVYWYEEAIKGGHRFSAFRLGTNYRFGFDDFPEDKSKAVHYLTMAAEWGHLSSMKSLADLLDDDDYYEISYEEKRKKAMYWYEQAAENGDEWAALTCGRRYENGYSSCDVNPGKAIKYYSISADKGLDDAYLPLAKLYLFSEGYKNFDLASKFVKLATQKESIHDYEMGQIQYCIGVMYRDGCGMPSNLEEAYNHFSLGASKGNDDCKEALTHIKKGLFGWKLV